MDKTFYTKEGKEIIASFRNELPTYEQGVRDVFLRLRAKDVAGAIVALKAVDPHSQALGVYADRAVELKTAKAREDFEANEAAFASSRILIMSASALTAALGLLLGYFIAKGFAVPLATQLWR